MTLKRRGQGQGQGQTKGKKDSVCMKVGEHKGGVDQVKPIHWDQVGSETRGRREMKQEVETRQRQTLDLNTI